MVPGWFSRILPLETAAATSEINDGWILAAQMTVTVHPGYAYLKLYEQAKRALMYSALAYVLLLLVVAVAPAQGQGSAPWPAWAHDSQNTGQSSALGPASWIPIRMYPAAGIATCATSTLGTEWT